MKRIGAGGMAGCGSMRKRKLFRSLRPLCVAVPVLAQCIAPASASGIDGLTIVGQWSDPVLAGYGLDGATRAVTFIDHTADAVYEIDNASLTGGASAISFGRPVSRSAFSNQVVFAGGSIPTDHDTDPFSLGAITYVNGAVTRTIFGATLSLFATNGGNLDIPLGSIEVAFNQTNNTGTRAQTPTT